MMPKGYNPEHKRGGTRDEMARLVSSPIMERLFEALKLGLPHSQAADLVGISRTTYWSWIRKGADPDAPEEYRSFLSRVRQAEAEGTMFHLGNVKTAAESGNWTASGWWLERKYPVEFGRTEISRVNYGKMSDRDLIEMATQLGVTISTEEGDRGLLEGHDDT
jgi:hypothetical protein